MVGKSIKEVLDNLSTQLGLNYSLSKARENMKLIEEHQRLEQNASTNK